MSTHSRYVSSADDTTRQLQAICQHTPAFISYVGPDFRYRLVSKHYESYFKRAHDQIIGREMREVLGEGGWKRISTYAERAMRGEKIEFRDHFVVDGLGPRWVEGTFTPDVDEQGTVRGMVVYVNDVTEQRLYERRLEDQDAFYRSMFESTGVANTEADLATARILRVNRTMCEMLGYSEAELLDGRTFFDITHPDDRARNEQLIQPLLRGDVEHFRIEKRYVRKDGSSIWVNVAVTALKDAAGRIDRLLGVAQDISARVEAEEAVRQSEERLSLAVRAAGIGYWTEDPETRVCTFDKVCSELFQLDERVAEEEAFSRIHPEDREHVRQAYYDSFTGERPYHAEFRVCYPDGRERWLMGLGGCSKDERGALTRLYGVNIDISERKYAEAKLKEADRRKDDFLATLAHELRNPLAPISNALQLWPLLENDPDKRRTLHAMMQRQVEQLKRLIDDLLDVSRISQGKILLRKKECDLIAIIDGAIETVRPALDSQGHRLHLDLPNAPVLLQGDAGRLTQLFGNLIHNAVKYTPREGDIFISVVVNGGEVEFRVRDTGVGIPREMLNTIFEPFAQVHGTLDRAQGGLGIGLTLVKKLVELHHGSVEARSEGANQGSEFIVRLPRERLHGGVDVKEVERLGGEHPAGEEIQPNRILVVDDVQPSADTLAGMLESLGQKTRVAYNGSSALEMAGSFKPTVVFSDIAMPGMDGLRLAQELRKKLGRSATLVAVTGYGQDRDRARSQEAGFDFHLTKPTTMEALRNVIEMASVSKGAPDKRMESTSH